MPKLLSFDGGAQLVTSGLEALQGQSAPLSVVTFIGDGRAGKSHLANELAGTAAFAVGSTAQAVTEGIDIHVQQTVGVKRAIIDCEGGNNALAPTRSLVNLLGGAMSTTVVLVANSMATEAALQMLGKTVAEMQLAGTQLQPKLVFVVNKCTLEYTDSTLEEILTATPDPAGTELRGTIRAAFTRRSFVAIPFDPAFGHSYQNEVARFRQAVGVEPLALGGIHLDGAAVTQMLQETFDAAQTNGTVELPNMHRAVLTRFLDAAASRILGQYRAQLPPLQDFDAQISTRSPKSAALADFDALTERAPRVLWRARRQQLEAEMDEIWDSLLARNSELGKQVFSSNVESREKHVRSYEVEVGRTGRRYGFAGPREAIKVTRHEYMIEARTRSVLKNGEETYSEWADSGARTTR